MEKSKPFILNLYKPKDITSYDIIRKVKPHFKSQGKIGHFGTLDPFADGVLMLGVAGAQRLNEYIHSELTKTYLAKGVLGIETETGDLTVLPSQEDNSDYLKTVISTFTPEFIEEKLQENFLGTYFQAPHKYSAAKYEGKPLHEYARQGVEIRKEKKERRIYKIEVEKFEFPNLWIRFEVSSGTYIRTLFSECANLLGTIGTLEELTRESLGSINIEKSLSVEDLKNPREWPLLSIDEVLKLNSIYFAEKEERLFINGVRLKCDRATKIGSDIENKNYFWVRNNLEDILGLAYINDDNLIVSKIVFI